MRSVKINFAVLFLIYFLLINHNVSNAQREYQPNILAPTVTNMRVNSFTGNLFYQRLDLFISAIGTDIDFSFYYNSALSKEDWGYGYGWTHTYNMNYVVDPVGDMIVTQQDGRVDTFFYSNGQYTPPVGIYQTLVEYAPSKYKLSTPLGTQYFFEDPNHQRLTKIEDRYGNTFILAYSNGKPTSVTDASGRSITLNWVNGHLAEIVDALETPLRTWSYTYDPAGNLEVVTDPLNGTVLYTYDELHRMTRMTDKNGNGTSMKYNTAGAVTTLATCLLRQVFTYLPLQSKTILDEFTGTGKQTTTFEFDEDGRNLVKSGSCCGYKKTFEYDSLNNVTQVIDARGNSSQYVYGTNGKATQVTDVHGCSSNYTYDATYGKANNYTDKNGTSITYDYDANGNLTQINLPGGLTEQFSYNAQGLLISSTNRNGYTRTYGYNQYGYLVSENYPINNYADTYTYDKRGNRSTHTNANNHTTQYEYDLLARLVKTIGPLDHPTLYEYDAGGNRISVTNSLPYKTEYDYNEHNYITEIRLPLETTYKMKYDGMGNLVKRTMPDGGSIIYNINEQNLPSSITDPMGYTTFYYYDELGNLTTVTDPNGNSYLYSYDEYNRLASEENPMGGVTNYTYDCNNNLISSTDPSGNAVYYEYDDLDRKVKTIDASGNTTSYDYDNNNNLTTIMDAKGNATEYFYDEMNRKISELFADGTSRYYSLDGVGNVASRTDGNGNVTTYNYDERNLLIHRDYPDSNGDYFEYDALGNLTFAQNENATIIFTYDASNQLTSEILNGAVTNYAYNPTTGKRTLIYPTGKIVEEQFDKRGKLTSVKVDGVVQAEFAYDEAGRTLYHNYVNGTSTSYSYNANDWLISLTANPNEYIKYTYSYDGVGNILTVELGHRPDHSISYEYDSNNQLTKFKKGFLINGSIQSPSKEISYTYDALGNRINIYEDGIPTTYTVNNMNQYVNSTGGQSQIFSYDDNGNLLSNGQSGFTYNYKNAISTIIEVNDTIFFQDDALGRRVKEMAGSESVELFYSQLQIIEEKSSMNSVEYLYGYGIEDLIMNETNESKVFYTQGSLHSVVSINSSSGNLLELYEYYPYGKVIIYDNLFQVQSSSNYDIKNFFTGRRLDSQNMIYYNRLRGFDSSLGRFLQRDPIGYSRSLNSYMYVLNNPINFFDPFGADVTVEDTGRALGWHQRNCVDHRNKDCSLKTEDGGKYCISFAPQDNFFIGEVYPDNVERDATGIWGRVETTCEEDIEIQNNFYEATTYPKKFKLLGYPFIMNCRSFSQGVLRQIEQRYGN
jgi:RHS repeat-associated protein